MGNKEEDSLFQNNFKQNKNMKTNIVSILMIAALFMVSCGTAPSNEQKASTDKHEHAEGDGHDHAAEKDHEHSEGDGHDHGGEVKKEAHADEIVFTNDQAKAVGLKTEVVTPQTFRNVIKTSGQVQAPQGDEQTVVATSNGVISFANASITDGVPVRAGETIVVVSAKNLQEGDPSLKAKIAFETAEKEYKRSEGLVADKIISTKEFEQTRLRYETAKAVYQGQAANVTASGIRITSPINGYIKNRLVSQGEYVSVGQPIATVAQNRRLQLRAEVSENYFKHLKSVNSANFKTAYDNATYKMSEMNGKLLSYGKTSSNNSFYIPVTFEFDNVGNIIPGAFAEVYLLAQPKDNIISVPVSALTEEQGLNFVYLQIEDDVFKKQEVTVGQNNGDRAEILKGLKKGDKIVTNGVYQVKLAASSSVIPDGHNH